MTESRPLDLVAVFQVLNRRRRFVIRMVAAFLVLGVVLSFVLPPVYESVAVILAPQENDIFGGFAGARRALSAFSAIGLLSSNVTPSDEYAAILRSDNVHRAIVKRFNLAQVYKSKNQDDAVKELRSNAKITLNADATIAVAVQDRDRQRAADLANAFVEELDRFNQDRRVIRGRGQVGFLQAQVDSTAAAVRRNEELVRQFGEKRHAPILSAEDKAAAEGAASLLARRTSLQVRRQVLSSYLDAKSDELAQTDIEISSFNREIAKLPALMVEGARLVRDLRVQEELFVLLKAQLEQARIKGAFDVATVEVLDHALPPARRASPNRRLVVMGMMLLGSVLALVGALAANAWEGFRKRTRAA